MTKQKLYKNLLGSIATALLLGAGTGSALAAGTFSGTIISNQATVDYNVAAVPQPTASSNNEQFVVDNLVNLTVATSDLAAISVVPGTNDNVMTFTVTNNGNTTQDFQVSAVALAGGAAFFAGTDNIDADAVNVFVETAGGAGYQAVSDVDTHIDSLAPDASIVVYIVSDFNLGYIDADIASYHLLAEARINDAAATLGGALTQTVGADTAGVDIIFADVAGSAPADGARDAQHSSQDDYVISASALTVTKSTVVISDPFNGTVDPKMIPGAVIEYQILIANAAGAATATSVTVTDSLNTEIATNGTLVFNTTYNVTAGQGVVVAHPGFAAGADTEYTNVSDGAENGGVGADWNVTGINTVTVTGITLNASESATVKFRVTIQ